MGAQVEPWLRIHEVFHPTDASQGDEPALLHALRIALAAEARLTLMRVSPDGSAASDDFPDVEGRVASWLKQAVISKPTTELRVRRQVARGANPLKACLQSLSRCPADLIVVATRQQYGKMTWLGQSVAAPLARSSREMTLLVPEQSGGFVCPQTGAVGLKSILLPLARHPSPEPAIEAARRIMSYLSEAQAVATVLHVGDRSDMSELRLPTIPGWQWNRVVRSGDVVETILKTADEVAADLVAMTTQGRNGFLDALRGSTTERVLRQARCPLLTMPIGSFLG